MRLIKSVLLAIILLGIVVLAIANRGMVTLNLLPEGLANLAPGLTLELPLFVVILGFVLLGLVIGYLFEYLREHKHRRLASQKIREADGLKREMSSLRRKTKTPKDDVLALMDG